MTCEFFLQNQVSEVNSFQPRKTTISLKLLIRTRFQGYNRESDMPLFFFKYENLLEITMSLPLRAKLTLTES